MIRRTKPVQVKGASVMLGKPVRSLIDLGLWNLATEGWVYSFEQCFIDKSKRKRGFPHFLLIKGNNKVV